MGTLADTHGDALGFQAHYAYGVSDLFAFDVNLGYSSHNAAEEGESEVSMYSLAAGLRTNLSFYDRVVPYGVIGLGFYKENYKDITTPVFFGVHLGPGVDLHITENFYFGGSLTFHSVFGGTRKTPQGNTREVGGTYTAFLLHTGYSF